MTGTRTYPPRVAARVVTPGVESLTHAWAWLLKWSSQNWQITATAVVGIVIWRCWVWLLDWEAGRIWPVLASLLPALIPFARDSETKSPGSVSSLNVAVLLLAVAVVQFYGQERNKRDRESADAEIRSISAQVRSISAGSSKVLGFLAEQGAQLGSIADAIGSLADEIQELKEPKEE